jgi:hypothetical protein
MKVGVEERRKIGRYAKRNTNNEGRKEARKTDRK